MGKFMLDVLERTLGTYVAAFVGLLLANGLDALSIDTAKAAAVAAIPAAVTVAKAAVGKLIGDPKTAAWLPASKPAGTGTSIPQL